MQKINKEALADQTKAKSNKINYINYFTQSKSFARTLFQK